MLSEMYLKDFLDKTASNDPLPGGGSVAALSSALAASLTMMVANLTIGKKKYASVNDEMLEIVKKLEIRKNEFVQLIDKDANSFDSVLQAFKMPKNTDEEKSLRTEAIQDGMRYAAKVPLGVAIDTSKLFKSIEYIVINGIGLKLFGEYNSNFTDELDGLIIGVTNDLGIRLGFGLSFNL
jgi:formiminotetrahydrofolate cyclodeaminase